MEPVYLYPSRWRLLFVPGFGLVGIALSLFMIFYVPLQHQPFFPHIFQVIIGSWVLFCSLLWVIAGISNFSHRACFLKLDDKGLTAAWLYLSFSLKWDNVKNFRTFEFPLKIVKSRIGKIFLKCVVVNVVNTSEIKYNSRFYGGLIGYNKGPEATAAFARSYYGADAVLITNYGLSAEGLANLLNEWKLRKQQTAATLQG